MASTHPDAIQNVKYHFERKPTYAEETVLKVNKDEYKVEYVLQVERPVMKNVVDIAKAEETNMEKDKEGEGTGRYYTERNKIKEIREETGMEVEQVLEQSLAIFKSIPNFKTMSEKDQMLVVADIINGKYDSIIFDNKQPPNEEKKVNKQVQAYIDASIRP